jgi:UDP-N-acetylmuramate dehydrogenase
VVKLREEIGNVFKGSVLANEVISGHTWYQIGGPCDYYCIPDDLEDLKILTDFCDRNSVPYFVHGNGSNLLVSDAGIRGVVIDLSAACSFTKIEETRVEAGAGVSMPKLVLECEKAGLGGLEMFAGIPGTIGGAVKMNAGCHGKEIFDVLTAVTVLEHGRTESYAKNQIEFRYRHVKTFDRDSLIILSGHLLLERTETGILAERRKEFMKKRQQTQPIHLPSSGSVFKNPKNDHAARLIDQCGLKGHAMGKAMISAKHANFIVNTGGATADDVLHLMKLARTKVQERFGITLELEVKLVGFTPAEVDVLG